MAQGTVSSTTTTIPSTTTTIPRSSGTVTSTVTATPSSSGTATDNVCDEKLKTKFLSVFAEVRAQTLAPMQLSGKWERITSIMDSGATVTVRNPKTGTCYPLVEGPAAKAGVMYEIADGTEIPNLGERVMAVMSKTGRVTAKKSQVANVSKDLTAVRQEMKNQKTVIFDSEGCFTLCKLTGEVTPIDDDGVNFTQDEWVIPPSELPQVLSALSAPGFPGQAP